MITTFCLQALQMTDVIYRVSHTPGRECRLFTVDICSHCSQPVYACEVALGKLPRWPPQSSLVFSACMSKSKTKHPIMQGLPLHT